MNKPIFSKIAIYHVNGDLDRDVLHASLYTPVFGHVDRIKNNSGRCGNDEFLTTQRGFWRVDWASIFGSWKPSSHAEPLGLDPYCILEYTKICWWIFVSFAFFFMFFTEILTVDPHSRHVCWRFVGWQAVSARPSISPLALTEWNTGDKWLSYHVVSFCYNPVLSQNYQMRIC